MGQRGQLDRIPVAHSGPVLSLDWVQGSSAPSTLASSFRQSASTNWYGAGTAFFDDIVPSVPVASTTGPSSDADTSNHGWIISGGMDRSVEVRQACPATLALYLFRCNRYGTFLSLPPDTRRTAPRTRSTLRSLYAGSYGGLDTSANWQLSRTQTSVPAWTLGTVPYRPAHRLQVVGWAPP